MRAVSADRFFPPGEVLSDRFELGELVGKGPFGEVFRAEDNLIDADVAVKIFDPALIEDPRDQEQFLRVTRTARTMTQNNVVRIHDSGVHKDHAWVSMQALDGLSLQKVIEMRRAKGENFTLEELEPIVGQITLALGHIHREFPHGDLKPRNVIFLPELIKVTDHYLFAGIDSQIFCERLSDSSFLAPELHTPSDTVDARCDVYSLGAIIGEMVFGADYTPGAHDVGSAQLAAVDALCRRATAFDPAERYPSVEALSEDFATLVDTGRLLNVGGRTGSNRAMSDPVGLSEPSVPPPAPSGPASSDPLLEETPQDIAEPLEDDVATREYKRGKGGEGKAELGDLLETNEVRRDELPPPPAPSADGSSDKTASKNKREATATAVAPTPAQTSSASNKSDDEGGLPVGLIVGGLLVAAALAGVFIFSKGQDPREPVEIGDRSEARAAAQEEASEQDGPDAKELAAAQQRAGKALLAARGQAVGATEAEEEADAGRDAGDGGADASDGADAGDEEGVADNESDDGARAPSKKKKASGAAASRSAASRSASKSAKKKEPAKSQGTHCKSGMVLVKSKKGNFCIDVYEYPARGSKPTTNVSWFKAEQTCKSKGKRLCRITEWRRACGTKYPYGRSWDPDKCNTVDEDEFERELAAAGSRKSCRSWTGTYDMTGNAHEWVAEQRIVGGGYDSTEDTATCSYSSAKAPGSSAPNIGFRCCADAE
ncbi:MAG: protein kinase domain-containing protein [Persicimonas sp.]